MTLVRLENSAWGLVSNCFVCEPSNPRGPGIPFFHDTESGAVVAGFALDDRFGAVAGTDAGFVSG